VGSTPPCCSRRGRLLHAAADVLCRNVPWYACDLVFEVAAAKEQIPGPHAPAGCNNNNTPPHTRTHHLSQVDSLSSIYTQPAALYIFANGIYFSSGIWVHYNLCTCLRLSCCVVAPLSRTQHIFNYHVLPIAQFVSLQIISHLFFVTYTCV